MGNLVSSPLTKETYLSSPHPCLHPDSKLQTLFSLLSPPSLSPFLFLKKIAAQLKGPSCGRPACSAGRHWCSEALPREGVGPPGKFGNYPAASQASPLPPKSFKLPVGWAEDKSQRLVRRQKGSALISNSGNQTGSPTPISTVPSSSCNEVALPQPAFILLWSGVCVSALM